MYGRKESNYDYGKLDIISDITSIPIEDKYFDAILCSEIFVHTLHPEEALKELSRLLKKGGRLILTAPFCSITHLAPYHYYSGFNSYWYEKILPLYDLKLIHLTAYGDYFQYLAQELHRVYSVAGTYCGPAAMTSNIEKESINNILRMLNRYTENSNGTSSQLLCYGFLSIAEKEN